MKRSIVISTCLLAVTSLATLQVHTGHSFWGAPRSRLSENGMKLPFLAAGVEIPSAAAQTVAPTSPIGGTTPLGTTGTFALPPPPRNGDVPQARSGRSADVTPSAVPRVQVPEVPASSPVTGPVSGRRLQASTRSIVTPETRAPRNRTTRARTRENLGPKFGLKPSPSRPASRLASAPEPQMAPAPRRSPAPRVQ